MILFLHPHIKDLFWTHLKRLIHRYQEWRGEFFTRVPAPPPEEQQVPDGEQASSRSAGEERHEGDAGHGRKRRLLVLHPALLQTALHWRQRESSWAWFIGQGTSQLMSFMPLMKAANSGASFTILIPNLSIPADWKLSLAEACLN